MPRADLQADLFSAPGQEATPHPVLEHLATIEPDSLSTKAALETLQQLKILLASNLRQC